MTNAERQARYRARIKTQAKEGVTPDDVRAAVRLVYEAAAADPTNRVTETYEAWESKCTTKRDGGNWRKYLPESANPEDYVFDWNVTAEEAKLLAKVGAVWLAMQMPPGA